MLWFKIKGIYSGDPDDLINEQKDKNENNAKYKTMIQKNNKNKIETLSIVEKRKKPPLSLDI